MYWTQRRWLGLGWAVLWLACLVLLAHFAAPTALRREPFSTTSATQAHKLGDQVYVHNAAELGQVFLTAPTDVTNVKFLVAGAKVRFSNFAKLDVSDQRIFTKPDVTKTLTEAAVFIDNNKYLVLRWNAQAEPEPLEQHLTCTVEVTPPAYFWSPTIPGDVVHVLPTGSPAGWPETSSKTIWASANAHVSAEVNRRYTFRAFVPNPSSTPRSANLYGAVDSNATWSIIDAGGVKTTPVSLVGGFGTTGPVKAPVMVPPGGGILEVVAWNEGTSANPAGLRVVILDANNQVLLRTDESWRVEFPPVPAATSPPLTCSSESVLSAMTSYYATKGPFAGTYTITPIRTNTVSPTQCDVLYNYYSVGVPKGSDKRRFTMSYAGGSPTVTALGPASSGITISDSVGTGRIYPTASDPVLLQRQSGAACTLGPSFGRVNDTTMYVSAGCRGRFRFNNKEIQCASSDFRRTECR